MKIFLSWAGEGSASHNVAKTLHLWLPNVIQSLQPWISSADIAKGSRPSIELARELQDHSFGIICVTIKSVDSKWLNFEAGALSKQLANSSVYPFLFRMRPSDVSGPLAGFQQVIFQDSSTKKDEVFKLVSAINIASGDYLISPQQLLDSFNKWWPDLLEQLDAIADDPNTVPIPRASDSSAAMEEILRILREHQIVRRPVLNAAANDDPVLVERSVQWSRLKNALDGMSVDERRRLLAQFQLDERRFVLLRYGLDGNVEHGPRAAMSAAGRAPNHVSSFDNYIMVELEKLLFPKLGSPEHSVP